MILIDLPRSTCHWNRAVSSMCLCSGTVMQIFNTLKHKRNHIKLSFFRQLCVKSIHASLYIFDILAIKLGIKISKFLNFTGIYNKNAFMVQPLVFSFVNK